MDIPFACDTTLANLVSFTNRPLNNVNSNKC